MIDSNWQNIVENSFTISNFSQKHNIKTPNIFRSRYQLNDPSNGNGLGNVPQNIRNFMMII